MIQKSPKAQENRVDRSRSQNAVSHSAETVTQDVTQVAPYTLPEPSPARALRSGHQAGRRRPAGPYLQRRGRIFYFRKRLPHVIAEKCRQKFFCLSLRTSFLPEAMSRVARLLAIVEREETKIMIDQTYQQMPAEEITLLLTEALRAELARILLQQDSGAILDDDAIDTRIALLEHESLSLKRRARSNDFTNVEQPLRKAAQALGIALPETLPNDLGRRAVDLIRELKDLEGRALDGEDARSAASPVVARFSTASVDKFLSTRSVMLSECWERALKNHPTKSMKGNIDAIARTALEFFGDVPVSMITRLKQEEFFAWMARAIVRFGTPILRALRLVDLDDQQRAADLIFASGRDWTLVRGSDLEEGPSEDLPVRARHAHDPALARNLMRRTDFALFMVAALTDPALIQEAPAITGRG